MAVFIGGLKRIGSSVKEISEKDFKKLKSIEYAAQSYAWNLKGSWGNSVKLERYRERWESLAESLGIFDSSGEQVRYKVKNTNKDYSHGYTFGDALA